jgi:hypothetical protein
MGRGLYLLVWDASPMGRGLYPLVWDASPVGKGVYPLVWDVSPIAGALSHWGEAMERSGRRLYNVRMRLPFWGGGAGGRPVGIPEPSSQGRPAASIAFASRSIPSLIASGRTAAKPRARPLAGFVRPKKYSESGATSTPRAAAS